MRFLLVGTYFTQGATAVIEKGLPQGARVTLRAEPDNPYDVNAVRVLVSREAVRASEALTDALAGYGLTLDTMLFPLPLGHLGASPDTKAAKLAWREGHHFSLCAKWHGLTPAIRESGTLLQLPSGLNFVEVAAEGVGDGDAE